MTKGRHSPPSPNARRVEKKQQLQETKRIQPAQLTQHGKRIWSKPEQFGERGLFAKAAAAPAAGPRAAQTAPSRGTKGQEGT